MRGEERGEGGEMFGVDEEAGEGGMSGSHMVVWWTGRLVGGGGGGPLWPDLCKK